MTYQTSLRNTPPTTACLRSGSYEGFTFHFKYPISGGDQDDKDGFFMTLVDDESVESFHIKHDGLREISEEEYGK